MSTDAPSISRVGTSRSAVAGFVVTKLLGNLFIRFPYVFITQISRGLGVDVSTLTWVFGARELGGLAAPQAGRWVDRGHTARVIVVGGLVAGVCCVASATPWFGLFVVAMVIGGAAKISIDLAQNAWIGHNVPLEGRGRIIGIVESTWAGAFLIGVPAVGWLIDRWGWQAGFIATGPLLLVAAVASGTRLPAPNPEPEPPSSTDTNRVPDPVRVSNTGGTGGSTRLKPAIWAFCFLQPMAQMLIFAVNGDWFDTKLHLSTGTIGIVAALLGIAELVGTLLAMAITDRFGSLRCGMWGILLTAPPLLGIVAAGTNSVPAIALMVVMDVGIEFAFVAVLPLVSELDVDNRGKAVGHVFVLIMVARAIASGLAGEIYKYGGFNASIVVAAAACVTAALALGWARAERPDAGATAGLAA